MINIWHILAPTMMILFTLTCYSFSTCLILRSGSGESIALSADWGLVIRSRQSCKCFITSASTPLLPLTARNTFTHLCVSSMPCYVAALIAPVISRAICRITSYSSSRLCHECHEQWWSWCPPRPPGWPGGQHILYCDSGCWDGAKHWSCYVPRVNLAS